MTKPSERINEIFENYQKRREAFLKSDRGVFERGTDQEEDQIADRMRLRAIEDYLDEKHS